MSGFGIRPMYGIKIMFVGNGFCKTGPNLRSWFYEGQSINTRKNAMTCYLGDSCNAFGRSTHAFLQLINCIYVALFCVEMLSLLIKGCRNGDTFSRIC